MSDWGPPQAPIGEWERTGGLDRGRSHSGGEVLSTRCPLLHDTNALSRTA